MCYFTEFDFGQRLTAKVRLSCHLMKMGGRFSDCATPHFGLD